MCVFFLFETNQSNGKTYRLAVGCTLCSHWFRWWQS